MFKITALLTLTRLSPGVEAAELADRDLGCVAAEKLDEVAEQRLGVLRPRPLPPPRHRRLSVELLRCRTSSPLLRSEGGHGVLFIVGLCQFQVWERHF